MTNVKIIKNMDMKLIPAGNSSRKHIYIISHLQCNNKFSHNVKPFRSQKRIRSLRNCTLMLAKIPLSWRIVAWKIYWFRKNGIRHHPLTTSTRSKGIWLPTWEEWWPNGLLRWVFLVFAIFLLFSMCSFNCFIATLTYLVYFFENF